MKRKIKQENNETASRSIDNLESGKKRIKISKYKATKENVIEESQNLSDQESEVESDDYESDIDLSMLTAGNEGMDLSSGNDEDSSDDESKSTGLKWTDKLKKTGSKPFKGPEPGALKHLSHQSSPLNHFYEVLPEKIFPLMTKSTNAYVTIFEEARRKKKHTHENWTDQDALQTHIFEETRRKENKKNENWTDQDAREFTMEDIKAYIGIRMIIAVDPKPCVDDYWSANPALGN